MENNSDCCKEQKVLCDTNHRIVKNKENSLRLKLVRVFNSGTLKSPKSPLSISSSQCSSPSYDSPRMKARYSWNLSSFSKEYSTLRALEDDTSSKSATNSPTSSSSPHSPYSTWYINESAGAAEDNQEDEYPHQSSSSSKRSRRRVPSSPSSVQDRARVMKYSPQQQQQKERKSESDICSIDAATPNRGARCHSTSTECKNLSSSSTRSAICRSPSTGMFAWMRVFRLASMLHQIGC